MLLLALLGCAVGAFLVSRSGGFSFSTTAGITDMVIATDIGADNKPLVSAQQVNLGTPVYVTFTAKQMKGKKITTRITRDGAPVEFKDNSNILTPEQDTVYYSLQFKPQQKGTYKAEAVVDDEATARQTATFTVK